MINLDTSHSPARRPRLRSRGLRLACEAAAGYAVERLERRVLLSLAAPVGPEFAVSETTAQMRTPAVATDAQGNFVAVWTAFAFGADVYARLYDAAGAPRGPAFRVNTITGGDQEKPVVAMDADGDFVVAWQGQQPSVSYDAIYARRFSASGAAQGEEFRLQSFTTRQQDDPSVGLDDAGNFVIAWQSYGQFGRAEYDVAAQQFDATGTPRGAIFRVNPPEHHSHSWAPSVDANAAGQFAVAWQQLSPTPTGPGVYARRFDAAGNAQGDALRVSASTATELSQPSVSVNASGAFAVAWGSPGSLDIAARRFDPTGASLGGERVVNAHLDGEQRDAVAVLSDAGELTVAWHGVGAGDGSGVYLRRFDADGAPLGGDFRVNTVTRDSQHSAAASVSPSGSFLVAWASSGNVDYRIAAQRFDTTDTPARVGDAVFNDADGDGVQDPGEVGRGGATVTLFNDAGVFVASTTTSPRGRYLFEVLPDRPHYLQFARPAGVIFAPRDAGGDDAADSDADRVTGRTAVFSLGASQEDRRFDAGLVVPASVSGVVYNDRDRNGTRDAGEAGLAGWVLFGDRDGDGARDPDEPSATSDFAGQYLLGELLPGATAVKLLAQDRWTVAPPRPVTLAVGQALTGVDFGNATTAADSIAGPVGPEFRVNTSTTGTQAGPEVAADAQGNFVVVWGYGEVLAQRFDAAGQPRGAEFRVNTNTAADQRQPRVAMDADGDFVVTWHTPFTYGPTGGIRAQRFNAAGAPQGAEFRVNTFGENSFVDGSSVGMDAAGNFVIAWRRGQQGGPNVAIYAQRFAADGTRLGAEFRANAYTLDHKFGAEVALDDDGDFVIAWTSDAQDGSSFGVYARRFGNDGQPLGDDFRVNTTTIEPQSDPSVDFDAAGNFVVTWKGHNGPGDDEYGVYAQRFRASGEPVGGEFRVNAYTLRRQQAADLTVFPDGGFLVAWESWLQDGSGYGVYARRYNAAGVPQGPEARLNTFTTRRQDGPAVAALPGGAFVATWHSERTAADDFDVYAQRFETSAEISSVGDRVFNDSDGDGAQEARGVGIDGAAVTLFNEHGSFAGSTVTTGGGLYRFDLLPARGHYLQFTAPAGTVFTQQDAADDARDSDADATGRTAVFAVAAGQFDATRDAGVAAPASVAGFVFSDRNGNGAADAGEPRLPGWTVFLDRDGSGAPGGGEPSAVSAADGAYSIGALLPGTHRVAVAGQDLWTSAAPAHVTLVAGEQRPGVALGNRTSVPEVPVAPVGDEFHVNTSTAPRDTVPAVAAAADGRFVVVWHRFIGGGAHSILGRRYGADGAPVGEEFLVQSQTTSELVTPVVAMDADGDFVVAWSSPYSDGHGDGVFARRFDASAAPLGPTFLVNEVTTDRQRDPSIAMDAAGNFVVTFSGTFGSGIMARRFAADGTPAGGDFRVDDVTGFMKSRARVVMEPDGDFVAAWQSDGQDGSQSGVFARRFAASGAPLGEEFPVNAVTSGAQGIPSVAVDPTGRFTVAFVGLPGASSADIFARRFNASGQPQGGDVRVNVHTTEEQRAPVVAVDAAGDILVAWQSRHQDGAEGGIVARRFSAAGVPIGGDLLVNTYTPEAQEAPAIARAAGDAFVVAWTSRQQAAGYEIYAQRFAAAPAPAPALAPAPGLAGLASRSQPREPDHQDEDDEDADDETGSLSA